jgi:hypothetical protein
LNLDLLGENIAFVALASRRLDEAVAEYKDLLRLLVPDKDLGIEEEDVKELRCNVCYNLACALSLRSASEKPPADARADVSAALDNLRAAVELGFDDWEHIKSDPDLAPIRGEEGYANLVRGR